MNEKELIEALRGLTRWVGFGISHSAYVECAAPQMAERDLDIAEKLIAEFYKENGLWTDTKGAISAAGWSPSLTTSPYCKPTEGAT